MTSVLWAALGMAVGAALLHGAFGLRRPIDRTYLSFACLMAFLALFIYLQRDLYRATTSEAAVEAVRHAVIASHLVFACSLVFIPAYTRVRVPRLVMRALWSGLAIVAVTNVLAPFGTWLSGPPELVHATFRGEPYTAIVAPPKSLVQYADTAFYVSLTAGALACAILQIRRGERQRGVTLALSLCMALALIVVDIIRDTIGASWPYVAEFGGVSWGLLMSVQLAFCFRREADGVARAIARVETQADRLQSMVAALHALEHTIQDSVPRLVSGLAAIDAQNPKEQQYLERMRRALTRLSEFGDSRSDRPEELPDRAAPFVEPAARVPP